MFSASNSLVNNGISSLKSIIGITSNGQEKSSRNTRGTLISHNNTLVTKSIVGALPVKGNASSRNALAYGKQTTTTRQGGAVSQLKQHNLLTQDLESMLKKFNMIQGNNTLGARNDSKSRNTTENPVLNHQFKTAAAIAAPHKFVTSRNKPALVPSSTIAGKAVGILGTSRNGGMDSSKRVGLSQTKQFNQTINIHTGSSLTKVGGISGYTPGYIGKSKVHGVGTYLRT